MLPELPDFLKDEWELHLTFILTRFHKMGGEVQIDCESYIWENDSMLLRASVMGLELDPYFLMGKPCSLVLLSNLIKDIKKLNCFVNRREYYIKDIGWKEYIDFALRDLSRWSETTLTLAEIEFGTE